MANVVNYVLHITDSGGNGVTGATLTQIVISPFPTAGSTTLTTSLSVSTSSSPTTITTGAGSVTVLDLLNGDIVFAYDPVASGEAVLQFTFTKSATTFSGGGVFSVVCTKESALIISSLTSTGKLLLDLTQAVPTSNTAQTTGDAFNAARADGFGKWTLSGTTLTLFAGDGTTTVRTFTLDSGTAPTQRS